MKTLFSINKLKKKKKNANIAKENAIQTHTKGQGLMCQVREGISKSDKDYLKKLGEGSQHLSNPTEQCYT